MWNSCNTNDKTFNKVCDSLEENVMKYSLAWDQEMGVLDLDNVFERSNTSHSLVNHIEYFILNIFKLLLRFFCT